MKGIHHLEMFLALNAEAFIQGAKNAASSVEGMSAKTDNALRRTGNQYKNTTDRIRKYNTAAKRSGAILDTLKTKVLGLVGAYAGLQTVLSVTRVLREADSAAFGLEASLRAANREFRNTGSAERWNAVLDRLSGTLRIYSKIELKEAAAKTIDMTKRLGLSADQMAVVIERTADLSAGKFDLADGVERVTAALRGEAEASEALGLTLNENYVKSWYEANGATEGAWKSLTDIQKAQVRYTVFLEQAIPLQGKASDSIKTLGGAYAFVKAKITDALGENKKAIEITREFAGYIADNADKIGELASMMLSGASAALQFVINNKKIIASLLLIVGGAKSLSVVIGSLSSVWRGFNLVLAVTERYQISGWFSAVSSQAGKLTSSLARLLGIGRSLLSWINSLTGLLAKAVPLLGAFAAGFALGKLLNQFDVVKRAGVLMAEGLTIAFLKVKQAWAWLSGGDTAAIQREINETKRIYNEMFNEIGRKAKETAGIVQDAHRKMTTVPPVTRQPQLQPPPGQNQQPLSGDQPGKGQTSGDPGTGMGPATPEQQAARVKKATLSMLGSYTKFREKSTALMESAMKDKAETFSGAMDEMGDKFKEFDEGFRNMLGGFQSGMEKLGSMGMDMGVFSGMSGGMNLGGGSKRRTPRQKTPTIKEEAERSDPDHILDPAVREELAKSDRARRKNTEEIQRENEGINNQVVQVGNTWVNVSQQTKEKWVADAKEMKRASADIVPPGLPPVKAQTGGKIGSPVALAIGGAVQLGNMLAGGHFPGYGGGDRRHVVAEDGEVMIRKESVKRGGLKAALAFNASRFDIVVQELVSRFNLSSTVQRQVGGVINALPSLPSLPVQYMQSGGHVTPAGGQTAISKVVEVRFKSGSLYGDESAATKVVDELQRLGQMA